MKVVKATVKSLEKPQNRCQTQAKSGSLDVSASRGEPALLHTGQELLPTMQVNVDSLWIHLLRGPIVCKRIHARTLAHTHRVAYLLNTYILIKVNNDKEI